MPAKTFLYYYFMFTTKYRKGFMVGAVAQDIQESVEAATQEYGMQIHAMTIKPNHLHLVIEIPPTISVADTAQKLKGRSSHDVRSKHPELQEYRAFWGIHYYARTVGPKDLERAIEFVNGR